MKKIIGLMVLMVINQGLIKQAYPINSKDMSLEVSNNKSFLSKYGGKIVKGYLGFGAVVGIPVLILISKQEEKRKEEEAKLKQKKEEEEAKLKQKKEEEKTKLVKEADEYYKQNKNTFFRYNLKNNDGNFTNDYYYKIFLPYVLNLGQEKFSCLKILWDLDPFFYQLSMIKHNCIAIDIENGDNKMKDEFKQLCKEFQDEVGVYVDSKFQDDTVFQLPSRSTMTMNEMLTMNFGKHSFSLNFYDKNTEKSKKISTNIDSFYLNEAVFTFDNDFFTSDEEKVQEKNEKDQADKNNQKEQSNAQQFIDWATPLKNKIKKFMDKNVENFLKKHQNIKQILIENQKNQENMQKGLDLIMDDINKDKNLKNQIYQFIEKSTKSMEKPDQHRFQHRFNYIDTDQLKSINKLIKEIELFMILPAAKDFRTEEFEKRSKILGIDKELLQKKMEKAYSSVIESASSERESASSERAKK